jgi:hypothetical protein
MTASTVLRNTCCASEIKRNYRPTMPRKEVDIAGQTFGYLKAIRRISEVRPVRYLWRCTAPGCKTPCQEFERYVQNVLASYRHRGIVACKGCVAAFNNWSGRQHLPKKRCAGPGCSKWFVPNTPGQKYHNRVCKCRAGEVPRTEARWVKRPALVECCNPEHDLYNPGAPKWIKPTGRRLAKPCTNPGRPANRVFCSSKCSNHVKNTQRQNDPVCQGRERQVINDPDLITKEKLLTSRLLEKYK